MPFGPISATPGKETRICVLGTNSIHTSAPGLTIRTDGRVAEANSADAALFISGQNQS